MDVTHYAVDCMIDGQWFTNECVFASRSEAKAYGQDLRDCGAVQRFRLRETDAEVKSPPVDEESSSDGDSSHCLVSSSLVNWAGLLDALILCPDLFHSGLDPEFAPSLWGLKLERAAYEERLYAPS